MKVHELKILPQYFVDVIAERKKFEVRYDDRNFQVGDVLVLREWTGEYTGRAICREIEYILADLDGKYLQRGYVILGIKKGRKVALMANGEPVKDEKLKCRDCKYYDMRPEAKHSVGYPCHRPNHQWRSNVASLKTPSTPACKAFERRNNE